MIHHLLVKNNFEPSMARYNVGLAVDQLNEDNALHLWIDDKQQKKLVPLKDESEIIIILNTVKRCLFLEQNGVRFKVFNNVNRGKNTKYKLAISMYSLGQ